jgi:hypothetical protein
MMIPMTVRSNYMVDGVPHARVVHHLPSDGQFGVGSALPILAARSGLRHDRADRQAVSYAMVSVVTRPLMSRQINSPSGMIGGMSARGPTSDIPQISGERLPN